MKKLKKEQIINIIIIIVYGVITFFIMLNHEPWRDEAQAWLIARDISLFDIFNYMKYEGHPCLWHLLLMLFAKLNFPYLTINIISWMIMLLSAILVIYKSPFNKMTKICVLLSSPFLYYYIAISRVYTLIAFLVILLAIVYEKKEEKPCLYGFLLLLLANTHVIMLGLVGVLILDFYVKNIIKYLKNNELKKHKKLLTGFVISVLGIILLILQLMKSISTNGEVQIYKSNYIVLIIQYINQYINLFLGYGEGNISNVLFILILMILFIVLIYCQIKNFKKHSNSIIIFYTSIIFQFAVYVIVYQYNNEAFLTAYFIALFCIWIVAYKKDSKNIFELLSLLIMILSIMTIMNSTYMIMLDKKCNYSSSKEMAKYINENIEKGTVFIAPIDYSVSAIIPYCKDYLFYCPQKQEYFTYVKWDLKRKKELNYDQFEEIIEDLKNDKNVYIICPKEKLNDFIEKMLKNNEIKEVYQTSYSFISDESYYLFELNN